MTPAVSSVANNAGATQYSESQDLLQTFRTQMGITAGPVGLTVMRMRFHISSFNYPSVNVPQMVLGVRVMDLTEAAAAEIDASPWSPTTNPHDDWMCFEPFGGAAWQGNTAGTNTIVDHYVDVRSMRKLDELGQTLVAIVSSVPPVGGVAGANFQLMVTSSVLLALP